MELLPTEIALIREALYKRPRTEAECQAERDELIKTLYEERRSR